MEPLRDFLLRELGSEAGCTPLSSVISICYLKLLSSARNAETRDPRCGSLQEKLQKIAAEFLSKVHVGDAGKRDPQA